MYLRKSITKQNAEQLIKANFNINDVSINPNRWPPGIHFPRALSTRAVLP